MADREDVRATAQAIMDEISGTYPHAELELVLDPDHAEADAFLWVDTRVQDEGEVQELWQLARRLCNDLWQEDDIFIVPRMRARPGMADRPVESEGSDW